MDRARTQALEERLIAFAVSVVVAAEALPPNPAARHIQGQVLRSGTAPALIYAEAQSAESKADFVHKMKVGLKELRETSVSARIIQHMGWLDDATTKPLLQENNELISIFVASVKTASGK